MEYLFQKQGQEFWSESVASHIGNIESIFNAASSKGITLWLESGWAIDARIGHITREHEDIDMAYPAELHDSYIDLLRALGFSGYEQMDYGFLMSKNGILIDCEPCSKVDEVYVLPGFPAGSCPPEPEGRLNGKLIRCISWQAMYYEFLTYEQEIPRSGWRPKDHESIRLIKMHLSTHEKEQVKRHLETANNQIGH